MTKTSKNFFRSEFASTPKTVVVKIGSQAITHPNGGEDREKISKVVDDIIELKKHGIEILLVSSGAIQSGLRYLPGLKKTGDLATGQALSAIGQIQLMKTYQELFESHGLHCGQVLLTHEDFKSKSRYLNAKNTLQILLGHNAIPILNENDSVSFQEIALGDNDQLAVMVAQMMEADVLVILTGPDGLYNKNPEASDAVKFDFIEYNAPTPKVNLQKKSSAGRGGMKTKLEAVKKLTPLGIPVILSSYQENQAIVRALTQSKAGSFFQANPKFVHSHHKGWLMSTAKSNAYIKVDEGAYHAILKGASVLPKGITGVSGTFTRGDCIGIKYGRKFFAVGLSQYSSRELDKIRGKNASEILEILGHYPSKVIIHRNHLVIKEQL